MNQQNPEKSKLEVPKIELIQEKKDNNSKQIVHEIVQNIVIKAIEKAQKKSKETYKRQKMLLAGMVNRKRKNKISIKIPKKLKIQRSQTQKVEIKDNNKQMIVEAVQSIVEKTIKSAKERQKDRKIEMDKKIKRALSGK